MDWLANNLAFSFVIGHFFGVFTIDVAYSCNLVARLKRFADENDVVVKYENLKAQLHAARERAELRQRFFLPFQTVHPLYEYMHEAVNVLEEIRRHQCGRTPTTWSFRNSFRHGVS